MNSESFKTIKHCNIFIGSMGALEREAKFCWRSCQGRLHKEGNPELRQRKGCREETPSTKAWRWREDHWRCGGEMWGSIISLKKWGRALKAMCRRPEFILGSRRAKERF